MKKAEKHKHQAARNENFYNFICNHSFYDWAATGLFYAAIHYIEGYLATKNISVGSHPERLRWISLEKNLRMIYKQYRILYDTSVNARYKFLKLGKNDIENLYINEFQPLKAHILPLY